MTTSPDLQTLVDDLRTMIRSDESADPAARAMAVIVLELAAATIFNLQRVADAVERLASNSEPHGAVLDSNFEDDQASHHVNPRSEDDS